MLTGVILDYAKKWDVTGSRYICNPPPMDTDMDFIILVDEYPIIELEDEGWRIGGSFIGHQKGKYGFLSFKRDDINYILTESEEFYDNFVHATQVAKRQNLLNKADRIAVFDLIVGK